MIGSLAATISSPAAPATTPCSASSCLPGKAPMSIGRVMTKSKETPEATSLMETRCLADSKTGPAMTFTSVESTSWTAARATTLSSEAVPSTSGAETTRSGTQGALSKAVRGTTSCTATSSSAALVKTPRNWGPTPGPGAMEMISCSAIGWGSPSRTCRVAWSYSPVATIPWTAGRATTSPMEVPESTSQRDARPPSTCREGSRCLSAEDSRLPLWLSAVYGPVYENWLNSAYCPELSYSSPGALKRDNVDMPSSERFAVKPVGLSRYSSSSAPVTGFLILERARS